MNNHSLVEFFLQQQCDPDESDRGGLTPLQHAARSNHLECMQHLFDYDCDLDAVVEYPNLRVIETRTARGFAVDNGYLRARDAIDAERERRRKRPVVHTQQDPDYIIPDEEMALYIAAGEAVAHSPTDEEGSEEEKKKKRKLEEVN